MRPTPSTPLPCGRIRRRPTLTLAGRGFIEAMRPYTIPGVSLNFTMDQDESRVRTFFPGGKYERLVTLKERYDPANLFRLNQNVKPSQPEKAGVYTTPAGKSGMKGDHLSVEESKAVVRCVFEEVVNRGIWPCSMSWSQTT
jgi:hypothetical protein